LDIAAKCFVRFNRQTHCGNRMARIDGLSAFTLIELLTVIAIIGLLAGLLLPTIAQTKRRSQRVQCAANLHQLSLGLHEFVADNQIYPLFGSWIWALHHEGLPYDYRKGVWRCPSARWYTNQLPGEVTPGYYSYNGYGLIGWEQAGTLGLGGGQNSQFFGNPTHESEVAKPDNMMALGDSLSSGTLFTREPLDRVERFGNASERHEGKLNVVFCDGHLESPTLTFLVKDTSDAALARWNRDHQPHRERSTY
jgi:prepilin-type N-terminal cleavage/methylation domain-containing protein/prepilin-type processing-associated H-X9-DG protein